MDVAVTWDDAAIRLAARDRTGPVGAGLSMVSDFAVKEMKRRCPVSPAGPLHRSGELRASIKAVPQPDGSVVIGPTKKTDDGQDLGTLIVQGTPAHIIRSKGPWPLRNRETGQVFGPVVHHPGTRPNDFIRPTAAALDGKRFTIADQA